MIHRIEAGDMVMYTGDAGYDQFKKAMREELIHMIEIESKISLKKENDDKSKKILKLIKDKKINE
jgi:hypothetical protein